MWIYEASEREEDLAIPEQTESPELPVEIEAEEPENFVQGPSLETAAPVTRPLPHRTSKSDKASNASRDCWFLVAAFLFGSLAAGALQAVCDTRQTEIMGYYLNTWRTLFAGNDLQNAVRLFGIEYLTLGLVVSLFLLLGFSALGPLLIFSCMMFYGLGSSLLLTQLFQAGGWRAVLPVWLWTGIPAALAGGCLCLFGTTALQVSSRIRAYSFWNGSVGQARPGVRAFLGQYLLTMVLLLPLCGAAAGLSCLGSRF